MKINLAILGIAHGHLNAYATKWALTPDQIQVSAVWDHDAARSQSAAKQFNLAVEPTVESLLARPDLTAVAIGAETSLHAELVEKAAAAKKAIILQKPSALTLEQADRIVAAVEQNNVPFTLAWQQRVDPQNIAMKKLVTDGTLGKIFQVRRRHCLPTHTWPGFENSWHVKPELNRGMWADDAAHPIDWVLWMFGLPSTVTAEIATLHNPKVPDDNGIAIFRYPDGKMVEVTCSFTASAGENSTEIHGEKGAIIQNFGDLVSASSPRDPSTPGLKYLLNGAKEWTLPEIPSPANHGERIAALAAPLLEFLQGKRPPIATAQEGRDSLRMTLASYQSANLGRRVAIDQIQSEVKSQKA